MKQFTAFFIVSAMTAVLFFTGPATANWLDESISTSTTPSESDLSHGIWAWGGKTTVRIPQTSVRPFNVAMPRISASGCGGIDAFWGGFTMMDADRIVQYAQNILAAAPSYAFQLALTNLCEPCNAVMGHLNKLASSLNNMSLDSCAAAQDLVNTALSYANRRFGEESIQGTKDSQAKTWYDEMEIHLANYSQQANDFLTHWVTNFQAEPLEKRLVIPEVDNRYLSFWVSVVADRMSNGNFTTFNAGYEAAEDFFQSPTEFIAFIRAVAGDIIVARGVQGDEPDSIVLGERQGADPSETITVYEIASKFEKLYSVNDPNVIFAKIDGANERIIHPVVSLMHRNYLMGLDLPDVPNSVYTTSAGQGFQGFPFNRPAGFGSGQNRSLTPNQMQAPDATIPGCLTPVACAQNRINSILSNINATNTAGVATAMSTFTFFNALPVYTFTNRIGLLSAKYPQILNEIQSDLAEMAAFSYAVARLNENLSYAIEMNVAMSNAISELEKKGFQKESTEKIQKVLSKQKSYLYHAQSKNSQFMMASVKSRIEHVTERINHWLELEKSIAKAVSTTTFSSIYAGDYN